MGEISFNTIHAGNSISALPYCARQSITQITPPSYQLYNQPITNKHHSSYGEYFAVPCKVRHFEYVAN